MGKTYKCPICGKIWYTIADVDKCFEGCKNVAKLAEAKERARLEAEARKAADKLKVEKALGEKRFEINKEYAKLKQLVREYNAIGDGFSLKYPDYQKNVCATMLSFSDNPSKVETAKPINHRSTTDLNSIIDSILKF